MNSATPTSNQNTVNKFPIKQNKNEKKKKHATMHIEYVFISVFVFRYFHGMVCFSLQPLVLFWYFDEKGKQLENHANERKQ